MTLLAEGPGESIDTAIAYDSNWGLLRVTNDGLVTWKRVGGEDGTELVPDLAEELPEPTNGGKTYAFKLREGIRYSTGETVKPSDFRYTFERTFKLAGPGTSFFSGILGAERCAETPKRCDLSEGIVTDDEAGTVTFKLTEPDSDFLQKLALPFGYVVPRGTPIEEVGTDALPATGPYMFERYSPQQKTVLVRNPEFEEWSADAQPEANPDRVEYLYGLPAEEQATMVANGEAHGMATPPPPGRLAQIASTTPDQLHTYTTNEMWFATLNTKVPPFDDIDVRHAVNLAVDRDAVVKLIGGPNAGQPSCQILPPEVPGYEPYCPYTANPGSEWTAPDMARARDLVARSGSEGAQVTLITWDGDPYKDVGTYLASVLRDLGYDVKLRALASDVYGAYVFDTKNKPQIVAPLNWFPDYPAASNFLDGVVGCNGYKPGTDANVNPSEFCDPEIQGKTEQALSLGQTDPDRALPIWTEIDHETTDQAPWISLYNSKTIVYVSDQLGNVVTNPSVIGGLLYEQATVE